MPDVLSGFSFLAWCCAAVCATWFSFLLATNGVSATADWCKRNGKSMFYFGMGAFAGALASFLIGPKPTDPVVGLCGSFAGIAAAVGGGLWLWQVQDAKSEKRTLGAIESSCSFLVPDLVDLQSYVLNEQWALAIASAGAVLEAFRQFDYRIKRYESHMIEIDARLQDAHAKVERIICLMMPELEWIHQNLRGPWGDYGQGYKQRGQDGLALICTWMQTMTPDIKALAPRAMGSWPY